jgi:ABC-2 type transport system ATP-binding protein
MRGINKCYGLKKMALQDINLHIDKGIFGLLGANGAGKTTLLRILATRIFADTGHLTIGSFDLARPKELHAIRERLGYVPQVLDFPPHLTGREYLNYIALLKGLRERRIRRDEVAYALEDMDLTPIANTKIEHYSGGMKRRLSIAQAFLHDPELIVIDDILRDLGREIIPTLQLHLLERSQRSTIVFSTTHINEIRLFSQHYAVLEQGAIKIIQTDKHTDDQSYTIISRKFLYPDKYI